IVKFRKGFVEDGQQAAVDLDADHLVGAAGKLGGQHSDAGANFDHSPTRLGIAHLRHTRTDGGIDQKVLPQTLGKGKSVAGKDIPNDRDVGQVFHEKLLSDGNSFGTNSFMASIIAQKSPPAEDVYKKVWEVHRK